MKVFDVVNSNENGYDHELGDRLTASLHIIEIDDPKRTEPHPGYRLYMLIIM